MLIRFVYLDEEVLGGYAAQLDGGLIAETKTRLVKKGSAGGTINFKVVGGKFERVNENEESLTRTYPPEAQFQRLLAVANDAPDTIAWIDVVDPGTDFAAAQVGETIAWECNINIDRLSRLAARGGGGSQLIDMFSAMADAAGSGVQLGKMAQQMTPEQMAKMQLMQPMVQLVKQMLEGMNVNRVAVGHDSDTEWSVFGQLLSDHVRVEDIDDERVIVVGKIKRVVAPSEARPIVNTEAMQLMQMLKPADASQSTETNDNTITGPALELDILAIYR